MALETLQALLDRASSAAITVASGDVAGLRVDRIVDDSRRVAPGTLFVARRGTTGDGEAFLREAAAAGAVAVLVEPTTPSTPSGTVRLEAEDPLEAGAALALALAGDPLDRLRLVGVTGTNGKTTVATLFRHLVAETLGPCGLVGTVDVHDGRAATPATLTTPGRLELAAILGGMVSVGTGVAVLETSSHALHQRRTADLAFEVAIFTNLTGDHLDYHGDMDAYAAAKASLFSGLSSDALAIVNLDDPAAATMVADTPAPVIGIREAEGGSRSGDGPACELQILHRVVSAEADRTEIEVEIQVTSTREGRWSDWKGLAGRATIPLVGRHNVFNATAAAAAVVAIGGEPGRVRAALSTLGAPRGRLEPVHGPTDDLRVYVDFAHTDDAIRRVLAGVRPGMSTGSGLVAVIGAGGDRDRTKRPRMMRAALDQAERVVVTSDNPRTEDPEAIVDDVLRGATPQERSRVVRLVDRAAAIRHAILDARTGDVVVIAGKGHETHQLVGTRRLPFDDVAVARAALHERRGP